MIHVEHHDGDSVRTVGGKLIEEFCGTDNLVLLIAVKRGSFGFKRNDVVFAFLCRTTQSLELEH